jgi:hypothetical protein
VRGAAREGGPYRDRSRGRRQPFCQTRRYQVEGEAQTVASRWARIGERAGRDVPVLERGHHVLDRPDLGWVSRWGEVRGQDD